MFAKRLENASWSAVVDSARTDRSKPSGTKSTSPNANEDVITHSSIVICRYPSDFETEIAPEDGLTFIICKAILSKDILNPDFKITSIYAHG